MVTIISNDAARDERVFNQSLTNDIQSEIELEENIECKNLEKERIEQEQFDEELNDEFDTEATDAFRKALGLVA